MKNGRLFFIADKNKSTLLLRLRKILKEFSSSNGVIANNYSQAPNTFGFRILIYYTSQNDFLHKLEETTLILSSKQNPRIPKSKKIFISQTNFHPGKTLFLFPGFGSEFPSMLNGLNSKFEGFAKWSKIINQVFNNDNVREPNWFESQIKNKKFGITESGPIGTLTSLIFFDILQDIDVKCDGMVGHSNGENAALIASGHFSLGSETNQLDLIQSLSNFPDNHLINGNYLLVSNFSKEHVEELLETFPNDLCLAMVNCPKQQVFYVKNDIKEQVNKFIKNKFGIAIELNTDHPYHTHFFRSALENISTLYKKLKVEKAKFPVYSCASTSTFSDEPSEIKDLAMRQWVEPVNFQKTIENAYADGYRTFIEVGPNNKLSGFVLDTLRGKNILVTNCSKEGLTVMESILEMSAQLWVNHIEVDLSLFIPTNNLEPIITQKEATNTYEKIYVSHQELMKRFITVNDQITKSFLMHALHKSKRLDKKIQPNKKKRLLSNGKFSKIDHKLEYTGILDFNKCRVIRDHALGKVLPVVPFTMSLELLGEMSCEILGVQDYNISISDVTAKKWLSFEKKSIQIKIITEPINQNPDQFEIKIYNLDEGQAFPSFQGYINSKISYYNNTKIQIKDAGSLDNKLNIDDFYLNHMFHGPKFRCINKIKFWNKKGIKALFKMPDLTDSFEGVASTNFVIPGVLLDCTGQLMAFWLTEMGHRNFTVFPFHLGHYEQYRKFPIAGSTVICTAEITFKSSIAKANIEIEDQYGNIICRMIEFNLRMYIHNLIPPIIMNNLENNTLDELDYKFLTDTGGIWKQILAKIKLSQEEYDTWKTKTHNNQVKHLLNIHKQKV